MDGDSLGDKGVMPLQSHSGTGCLLCSCMADMQVNLLHLM